MKQFLFSLMLFAPVVSADSRPSFSLEAPVGIASSAGPEKPISGYEFQFYLRYALSGVRLKKIPRAPNRWDRLVFETLVDSVAKSTFDKTTPEGRTNTIFASQELTTLNYNQVAEIPEAFAPLIIDHLRKNLFTHLAELPKSTWRDHLGRQLVETTRLKIDPQVPTKITRFFRTVSQDRTPIRERLTDFLKKWQQRISGAARRTKVALQRACQELLED